MTSQGDWYSRQLPEEYFRDRLLRSLCIPPELVFGDTKYSTLGGLGAYVGMVSAIQNMVRGNVILKEYIRYWLPIETQRHRGKKRLRKKRAKQALLLKWALLQDIVNTGRKIARSQRLVADSNLEEDKRLNEALNNWKGG